MLNEEWANAGSRVHFAGDYYSNNGFQGWLISQGETEETIGNHAGIRDTSQLLAVAPQHIRLDKRASSGGFEDSGVSGDPTRASAEYGRKGMELKVETAVTQITTLLAAR